MSIITVKTTLKLQLKNDSSLSAAEARTVVAEAKSGRFTPGEQALLRAALTGQVDGLDQFTVDDEAAAVLRAALGELTPVEPPKPPESPTATTVVVSLDSPFPVGRRPDAALSPLVRALRLAYRENYGLRHDQLQQLSTRTSVSSDSYVSYVVHAQDLVDIFGGVSHEFIDRDGNVTIRMHRSTPKLTGPGFVNEQGLVPAGLDLDRAVANRYAQNLGVAQGSFLGQPAQVLLFLVDRSLVAHPEAYWQTASGQVLVKTPTQVRRVVDGRNVATPSELPPGLQLQLKPPTPSA